nr:N-acetylmuramic acid 6-phosphate etherase [Lapidilactobacillus bayanensis]
MPLQLIKHLIALKKGGRLIYCGAGTSGRLGALDAIELTPTYGVDPKRAFAVMAGGKQSMFEAIEGAEDSIDAAIRDLKDIRLSKNDILIGITASGNTPYTVSALKYGNKLDALTIGISCHQNSKLKSIAQIGINPIVGNEVIDGSTRMKAGTAQKMVLNALSTGIMIRVGYVYDHYMIMVQPTNNKLNKRAIKIIQNIVGVTSENASNTLIAANGNIAQSILMLKFGLSAEQALQKLAATSGDFISALNN